MQQIRKPIIDAVFKRSKAAKTQFPPTIGLITRKLWITHTIPVKAKKLLAKQATHMVSNKFGNASTKRPLNQMPRMAEIMQKDWSKGCVKSRNYFTNG